MHSAFLRPECEKEMPSPEARLAANFPGTPPGRKSVTRRAEAASEAANSLRVGSIIPATAPPTHATNFLLCTLSPPIDSNQMYSVDKNHYHPPFAKSMQKGFSLRLAENRCRYACDRMRRSSAGVHD